MSAVASTSGAAVGKTDAYRGVVCETGSRSSNVQRMLCRLMEAY